MKGDERGQGTAPERREQQRRQPAGGGEGERAGQHLVTAPRQPRRTLELEQRIAVEQREALRRLPRHLQECVVSSPQRGLAARSAQRGRCESLRRRATDVAD